MTPADDTNDSTTPKRKVTQTATATIIAAAIATASSSAVSAYQAGGSQERLRLEVMQYVAEHYVTRESGEMRAAALTDRMSSGFVDVQRQLSQIQDAIRDVPKMSAQLDALQRKEK